MDLPPARSLVGRVVFWTQATYFGRSLGDSGKTESPQPLHAERNEIGGLGREIGRRAWQSSTSWTS